MNIKKMTKKLRWYDVSLTKLSVFFATLFLISVWPGFYNLVMSINWYWYLILMIVFAIPVIKRVWF